MLIPQRRRSLPSPIPCVAVLLQTIRHRAGWMGNVPRSGVHASVVCTTVRCAFADPPLPRKKMDEECPALVCTTVRCSFADPPSPCRMDGECPAFWSASAVCTTVRCAFTDPPLTRKMDEECPAFWSASSAICTTVRCAFAVRFYNRLLADCNLTSKVFFP
jgi:hypothetical protein